jgi:hypothetical protein
MMSRAAVRRATRLLRNCAVVGGVLYVDFELTGVLPSAAVQVATTALPRYPDAASRALWAAVHSNGTSEQVLTSRTVDVIATMLLAPAVDKDADDAAAVVAVRHRLVRTLDQCANSPLTHAAIVRSDVVPALCVSKDGAELQVGASLLAKLASGSFGERTPVDLYTRSGALRCAAALCAATSDVVVHERAALALRRLAGVKSLRQRMFDDKALDLLLSIALRGAVESSAHVVAALALLTERRDVALAVGGSDRWLGCLRQWAMRKDQREMRLHAAETLSHALDAADDDALMVAILRRVGVDVFESLVESVDSFSCQAAVERCLARLQAKHANVDIHNEVYIVDENFQTRRKQIKVKE